MIDDVDFHLGACGFKTQSKCPLKHSKDGGTVRIFRRFATVIHGLYSDRSIPGWQRDVVASFQSGSINDQAITESFQRLHKFSDVHIKPFGAARRSAGKNATSGGKPITGIGSIRAFAIRERWLKFWTT